MGLTGWKGVVFLLFHLTWVTGEETSRSDTEKEILQKIFLVSKFHMYVRPEQNVSTDEPLEVSVSLYVLNADLNIKNQECDIIMYFRQEWNDSRLAYEEQGKINVLSIHDAVGFWTPDLFFVNEKAGHLHVLTKPNTFVRIYPQGKILYSQRLSVKLSCPVDLRKYPFDTQICTLLVESYGYTANDLKVKWKPDTSFGINKISDYSISYSTLEETIHVGENSYSRLELNLHLTRAVHTFLLHIYIPLSLLVVVSWITFWMRPSAQIQRLTAATLQALTTLVYLQSVKEFFHPQPNLTALDLWTGFSTLLIFGAVAENIYVTMTQVTSNSMHSQKDGTLTQKDVPELQKVEVNDQRKITKIFIQKLSGNSNLDKMAKLTFPPLFILFNIIYMAYYLI